MNSPDIDAQQPSPHSNALDVEWRSGCPIASALDLIGDRWSLLILRDLLLRGEATYSDFLAAPEGISTNILATRLRTLTELGLIRKVDESKVRNSVYALTPAGRDLEPVVVALGKWSTHHFAEHHPDLIRLNGDRLELPDFEQE